jgi:hypothetical protein
MKTLRRDRRPADARSSGAQRTTADARGARNLGSLLERWGDRAGALRAFRRAGEHGPPEVAELAYAALQQLDYDEDDGP